jgi:hypothetical protein
MEERMSPVFDRHLVRRWFHLPAFAVIALAATTAYVADRGLDTWKAWKVPRPETKRLELTGEATISHVPAQRISWSIELSGEGRTDGDALRNLGVHQQQVVQQLLDAGLEQRDIATEAPSTSETTEYNDNPSDWASTRRAISHGATRVLRVSSQHVEAGLAAYRAVTLTTASWVGELEPVECSADANDELRRRVQDAAWADLQRLEDRVRARSRGVTMRTLSAAPSNVYVTDAVGDPCTEGLEARATVTMTYELR